MTRIILILTFLIITGTAFASTFDFGGMWSGGDCMGCRPGMIFFQKARTAAAGDGEDVIFNTDAVVIFNGDGVVTW